MKNKPKQKPLERPHPINQGELFIKETYLRLHRSKLELTTEQALEKLNSDLRVGSVVIHGNRAEITIYLKK